ncbi:ATP-binding protein [Thermomonospora amylolytica]|uniref:ATP-binding protein n=1 Tax=Thermomonospora amylolytica TaxID=1411117 RepID=UPI000E6C5865|nr:helix-turn-helix transcriptional regulator [Thermomonospora amylolytica]
MLYGRDTEQAEIDRLLAGVRAGRGGALVLCGEAGIGKSSLLEYAAAHAEGMRVLRAVGFEAEVDLAFAGLHQLLWPVQDRVDRLPDAQAAALRTALGSATGAADRFTIGLAVLTLLADLAGDGPVLCLVDDAQWVDSSTAEALLFAARRVTAEGVAMIFAAREGALRTAGLPELALARLAPDDARRLPAVQGLPPTLRERVIAESAGNPLALVEFAAVRRIPNGPVPLPVADRVLAGFRAQIAALPERTRLMLLIASAEGRGYMPSLLGAARRFGVGLDDLEEAERAGLVEVTGDSIGFRHPLIRAAAYQDAVTARRVEVHRVLADTADEPGCRARHLASAALGPDEEVAAELQRAAERALARGGHGPGAALFRQAADLTPEPAARARRLGAAASAALRAGRVEEAGELADQAERLVDDPAEATLPARVRAAVEYERGDARAAARLLVRHARHAPPAEAQAMLRTGALYAWAGADLDTVRAADEELRAVGRDDRVVAGLARLAAGDHAAGLPPLRELVAEARRALPSASAADLTQAVHLGLVIGDDAAALELATAAVARCRRDGQVGALPDLLEALARAQVDAGLHREAEATVAEAAELARTLGMPHRADRLAAVTARVAAIEGDGERLRALTPADPVDDALALLDLGAGRYPDALRRLAGIAGGPRRHTAGGIVSAADHVEAAVRAGRPEDAQEPMRRLRAWADAGGGTWSRALLLRCRGLLEDAEEPYAEAVRAHRDTGRPFERARTQLLYGEWLRRARRRSDARDVLRPALETFESLRAGPWAERARAELRAAGDAVVPARAAAPDLLARLTPQERQVVRLAAEGISSREIAAQLFLSPRTVEYHLYKAYPKLGVSSRRELSRLQLEPI